MCEEVRESEPKQVPQLLGIQSGLCCVGDKYLRHRDCLETHRGRIAAGPEASPTLAGHTVRASLCEW